MYSFSPDYLKQQGKENENFDKALEATESGKGISKELKDKFEKTPDEIEEEKKKWQQIENSRTTAQEEYKHHTEEIEKIDENLSKLTSETHPETIEALKKKRTFHANRQELTKKVIDDTAKHYEKRCEKAKVIEKGVGKSKNVEDKNFWENEQKKFREIHDIPTQHAQYPIKAIEEANGIKTVLTQGNPKINGNSKGSDNKEHNQNKTKKNNKSWSI